MEERKQPKESLYERAVTSTSETSVRAALDRCVGTNRNRRVSGTGPEPHPAGRQALDAGDDVRAERLAIAWLTHVERDEGADALATAHALHTLVEASLQTECGKPDAPLPAERAVRLRNYISASTTSAQQTPSTIWEWCACSAANFPLAITALERSLAIRTSVPGPDTSEVASTLEQLALAQIRLGAIPRCSGPTYAVAADTRAVGRAGSRGLGTNPRTGRPSSPIHGQLPCCATAIDRALDIQRRLAPRHPDKIFALQTRGDVLLLMGDASGAEQDWKSALDLLATRTLRADHPLVAETLGQTVAGSFFTWQPRRSEATGGTRA